MSRPPLKPNHVIKYDYVWWEEHKKGQLQGRKDRPCAVVTILKPDAQGRVTALVCPITHTKPENDKDAVRVPPKVGKYLGLDAEQSWIKTNELNRVPEGDPGVIPVKPGQWEYGKMPKALYDQVLESVRQHQHERNLDIVDRRQDDEEHENGWER